jgi:hypothetical protein
LLAVVVAVRLVVMAAVGGGGDGSVGGSGEGDRVWSAKMGGGQWCWLRSTHIRAGPLTPR